MTNLIIDIILWVLTPLCFTLGLYHTGCMIRAKTDEGKVFALFVAWTGFLGTLLGLMQIIETP